MLIALVNFNRIAKLPSSGEQKSRCFMILHFVFVISAQVTAFACAYSARPWDTSASELSDEVYFVCIIIWTFIRKFSEFSIILLVKIMYQNQQEAIREDFFQENDKKLITRPSI